MRTLPAVPVATPMMTSSLTEVAGALRNSAVRAEGARFVGRGGMTTAGATGACCAGACGGITSCGGGPEGPAPPASVSAALGSAYCCGVIVIVLVGAALTTWNCGFAGATGCGAAALG